METEHLASAHRLSRLHTSSDKKSSSNSSAPKAFVLASPGFALSKTGGAAPADEASARHCLLAGGPQRRNTVCLEATEEDNGTAVS